MAKDERLRKATIAGADALRLALQSFTAALIVSHNGERGQAVNHRKPILLVEDDENDAFLMQLALKEAHIGVPLVVVRNGAEAIAYITRKGIYSKRSNYPLPRLMLLDLHMPGMDGFDVLEWLRRQPDLSGFRTVVLSASGLDSDRQRAAALGACDYKVKPNTFHELVQILQDIDEHWLHLCPRSFTQSTNPPGPGAAAGSAATAVTSTTSGIYASPAELKH